MLDASDGTDWPAYGRTYGEQHYSPLTDISTRNITSLGLAWSMDLGVGNPATIPVEVDGVLYFSNGLSVVHAVDVINGKQLWEYDTQTAQHAGDKLRQGWGNRGIAYWNGRVYTGTNDGRLIAIDAKTGKEAWSVLTVDPKDGRYITGAPRVFDGKIIIGHGGADSSNVRGYVTTYDADTGKQLWRFYTVPGDPAKGFEDKVQAMAAKTWHGQWWKYGGGGTAWNAFAYDPDQDIILVGTGNGAPWNQKIRSEGSGDNLFLSSIVALDAKTGEYRWHYQVNPGETWDYNACMDMEFADLKVDGKLRKVVMTAPKNGFFYVIDRTNGKLISAEKFARATWASRIDVATGRPVENPAARFKDGGPTPVWPGPIGAHSWPPMAFSPRTTLAYIPKREGGALYGDRGIDPKTWQRLPGNLTDPGLMLNLTVTDPLQNTSSLLAWNPVTQKKVWEVPTKGGWNGGVLATAGDLVFQGQIDGRFSAYDAANGKELWSFDGQAAIIAAPITYRYRGKQFVTVLVGMGTSAGTIRASLGGQVIDNRTQAKRVLTFVLNGKATLPPKPPAFKLTPVDDPDFTPNATLAARGAPIVDSHCIGCHGVGMISGGLAPDLRASPVPASKEAFAAVVRDGALMGNGMPKFQNLSDEDLEALRQYIRTRARALRDHRED